MAVERNVWHVASEAKRTYFYKGGEKVVVLNVAEFKVSANGRHYLLKSNGQYMIMRKGWLALKIDGELVVL